MPEWHQFDSSTTMSEQQESAKKKTLKSSSRLFWFSTGLVRLHLDCIYLLYSNGLFDADILTNDRIAHYLFKGDKAGNFQNDDAL